MARGRGRGRGSSSRPTRKIAKSPATRSSLRLASRCRKVWYVEQSSTVYSLSESSSSLNLNEANVDNHVDSLARGAAAIYVPAPCTSSTSNAAVDCDKNKGVAIDSPPTGQLCALEVSGQEHLSGESHSAAPSSSPTPIARAIEAMEVSGHEHLSGESHSAAPSSSATPIARVIEAVRESHSAAPSSSPTPIARAIEAMEVSGQEHLSGESHSAAPSSSPTPIDRAIEAVNLGSPTPSGPAFSSFLTEVVNNFQHDSSDEAEVGSAPPKLVRVHDYKVKEASAGILGDIIKKYGDIAANCNVTTAANRSRLLEIVCDIVQELKETDFRRMSQVSIERHIDNVSDLKRDQMGVDWLSKRLEDLSKAKLLIEHMHTLKKKKDKLIQERGEAMAKMRYADAEIKKINSIAMEARPMLLLYTKSGSMADGLL